MSKKCLLKIDMHIHTVPSTMLYRNKNGGRYPTVEEQRYINKEIGIERSLLLPEGAYGEGSNDTVSMREAYNMVKDNPDVFGWWFCNLAPEAGGNSPTEDLSFFLNQFKEKGAKGLGELVYNRVFDEDPYLLNLLKHCELCNLPVVIHIGKRYNDYGVVDEVGLYRLEHVLQMFPKLMIIGHSQKFWSEMSADVTEASRGGYPNTKVIPGRLYELMRKYPNLYADLSAGSGYNAIARDPENGYRFLEEFQDKLFFATDLCDPTQLDYFKNGLSRFLDEAMEAGHISYTAYYKICRGNALYLLDGASSNTAGMEID